MAAPNPKKQRDARAKLAELFAHPASVLVIHYACQSFTQPQPGAGSPRVASIAVRNLGTGETRSFSIHQETELAGMTSATGDALISELERGMLERYFRFAAEHKAMRFVHWNMRDVKFGFAALEHRGRVLGLAPYEIHDSQKIDLAMLLSSIYGTDYAKRPHMESLARKNRFPTAGYVPGAEEPELFARGEYFAVLKSNLAKVALMGEIVEHAHNGTLRTDAGLWAMNFGRMREAYEFVADNPVYGIAMAIITGFGAALKLFEYLGW